MRKYNDIKELIASLCFTISAGLIPVTALAETVTTQAADGATIYGETYYGDLGDDAPILVLYHQAGGDGRGEYGPLTGWLNASGFRAVAWDLRSGGDRFGFENRTAAAFDDGIGYCEAYPDMEAAFQFTGEAAKSAPVVVWGSSYSAALVFTLAANHPDDVDAVVAASPASGDPMQGCMLEPVLPDVQAPVLAMRPRREYDFTKAQADTLIAAGVTFHIVEDGVHGSSMLIDERTKHDMSSDRAFVASWLTKNLGIKEE